MPLDASMICFGHYGFREDVKVALKEARDQLSFWVEVVRSQLGKGEDHLEDRIIAILKKEDAAFANIKYLADDIQQREGYFVGNSLKGMKEYVISPS